MRRRPCLMVAGHDDELAAQKISLSTAPCSATRSPARRGPPAALDRGDGRGADRGGAGDLHRPHRRTTAGTLAGRGAGVRCRSPRRPIESDGGGIGRVPASPPAAVNILRLVQAGPAVARALRRRPQGQRGRQHASRREKASESLVRLGTSASASSRRPLTTGTRALLESLSGPSPGRPPVPFVAPVRLSGRTQCHSPHHRP
jgi:hypothetical protein